MTELLSLPDLPAAQLGSAQVLVAATGSGGAVAYKVALASYLTVAGAAARFAPLANPTFSGVPSAPTAAAGTNTTQIATTAFVTGAMAGLGAGSTSPSPPADLVPLTGSAVTAALGFTPYNAANPAGYIGASGAPVQSVAGRTGSVTLVVADVLGAQSASEMAAAIASSTCANVSGTIAVANGGTGATTAPGARAALGLAPVAATGSFADLIGVPAAYSLPVASTSVLGGVKGDGITVTIDGGGVISAAAAPVLSVAGRAGAVALGVSDVAGAAPLASPTFTGTPSVPGYMTTSAAASTYQPLLGFTPYSASNPAGYQTAANVTTTLAPYLTAGAAASIYAPLASPTFIGTPAAPTAMLGVNTTQVATTAFVMAALGAAVPSTAFTRGIYTTSGAISVGNTLAILNGTSATLVMTLANGTTDGQPLLVKLVGTASANVTAVIDGASQSVSMTASAPGTIRDALKLKWSAGDTSWLAE